MSDSPLTPSTPAPLSPEVLSLIEKAQDLHDAAKAPATLKAYRNDWACWSSWCERQGCCPLPAAPEAVALYIADLAGVKAVATIQRRLTSISVAHKAAGHDSPTKASVVTATWKGIRRTFGTAQNQKAPARTQEVRAMVATLGDGPGGIRDRALLLIGFAGALRRSELVALDVDDVLEREDGLVVTIRKSKTDQDGAGEQLGLPFGSDPATCPVRALRRWYEVSGITDGPIFRPVDRHGTISPRRLSDKGVAVVVKRTALAAGLDPTKYSGHSLRAGLITAAAESDVAEHKIQRHSRHKTASGVRSYIRGATLFKENAAMAVGL